MPTTITSTSGNTYHLFQLAEASYWEPEESIRFEELENDLGDGYFSQALYGANTGLRRWKLKLPTLAHTDVLPNTVTDVSGATVSREEYLWNLFCHTKVTGEPFVFRSPRNGQYYLVRFADKELSYQKMRVKIYSTGVELKQVRVPGESIFNPLSAITDSANCWLKGTETDESGSGHGFTYAGDVIEVTVNGLPVSRFNSVTNSGRMVDDEVGGFTYYDIFLLMKIRSGTFSSMNNSTVLVGSTAGVELLLGIGTDTKFGTAGVTLEYRLNGTLYGSGDMQAPMNTFGVVHLRFLSGQLVAGMMFGENDVISAQMDIAEVLLFGVGLRDDTTINSINEYLTVKANQLNGN